MMTGYLRIQPYRGVLFLWLVIVSLASCRTKQSDTGKLSITTTIAPAATLLEHLGSSHLEVTTLLPKGNNPENYEPTPQDILSLSESRAYFFMGDLGFERSWITRIQGLLPQLPLVRLDQGLHHRGERHQHDGVVHDPHYWMSLSGLRAMAGVMYEALIRLDTLHRNDYSRAYDELQAELNELEGKLRSKLQDLPTRGFVIYHPSLSEFAHEWLLEQFVIEEDGKEPSPTHLESVISRAREAGVRVVFIQKEFETKLVKSVAKELGAKIVEINPLDGDSQGELLRIADALAQAQ
ncbi:metal ABC transporter solute-binding protein, Zn/Mn family [Porphyromonas catoniae]|uniref:metal ABC transporter solute-binding protein, Zn/Mn family n=1 Tax=Porphyromonas catoniae TaxID=41976 RepID=UPI0028D6B2D2|nr:zinc ABC transporter substrate-binding protein [Porphyromonas catoniae]